ncbi:hypothetical protein [Streptomyces varsoviensis]|uniref:Uncharacterized protein n=1 Tax=Streptomyces varsoviensis TaxID=67373 RepID=A0ABR5IXK6_9ACTN|nr:hypothetical protein [Streptomyces varsoviensis]KOG85876.1 hypothetical protein ADK38_34210 [Streptomyces varsoviensis]
MSLSVDVFVVGEDGQVHVLDVPEGSSDLAGFERWRTVVWGSDAVRSLGARFFPALAGDDLKVFPHQVTEFLAECALLRSHIEVVAPRTDPAKSHAEYVRQISERLRTIEDAADRARGSAGGVLIW